MSHYFSLYQCVLTYNISYNLFYIMEMVDNAIHQVVETFFDKNNWNTILEQVDFV